MVFCSKKFKLDVSMYNQSDIKQFDIKSLACYICVHACAP